MANVLLTMSTLKVPMQYVQWWHLSAGAPQSPLNEEIAIPELRTAERQIRGPNYSDHFNQKNITKKGSWRVSSVNNQSRARHHLQQK